MRLSICWPRSIILRGLPLGGWVAVVPDRFHFVIIPLTVDCGIFRSEDISRLDLLHWWNPITVPRWNSLSSWGWPILSQMFAETVYMLRCLLLSACVQGSDRNTWFQLFGWVIEYFLQCSVYASSIVSMLTLAFNAVNITNKEVKLNLNNHPADCLLAEYFHRTFSSVMVHKRSANPAQFILQNAVHQWKLMTVWLFPPRTFESCLALSWDQSITVTQCVISSHPHLTSSASGCLFSGLCSRLWHIATSHRRSSISSWETL